LIFYCGCFDFIVAGAVGHLGQYFVVFHKLFLQLTPYWSFREKGHLAALRAPPWYLWSFHLPFSSPLPLRTEFAVACLKLLANPGSAFTACTCSWVRMQILRDPLSQLFCLAATAL
jgi:hypothetical protein